MIKVKKIQEVTGEVNMNTIADIKIEELYPNVIDKLLVTIVDKHHTIFIPMNVSGIQFKNWKKGRGGILSKDILNYSLNKLCGKYVIIKEKDLNCVARIINEDEELNFKTLKLIDGKIKDRPYMILKSFEIGSKLTSTFTPDEDFEHSAGSIDV